MFHVFNETLPIFGPLATIEILRVHPLPLSMTSYSGKFPRPPATLEIREHNPLPHPLWLRHIRENVLES